MVDIRYTRKDMISSLQENICTVIFEKKNNEIRQMHCTLNIEFAPEILETKGKGKSTNESVISVWDTENIGWRSFRVGSVLQFDVLEAISAAVKMVPKQIVEETSKASAEAISEMAKGEQK